jgi:hypothetical protein
LPVSFISLRLERVDNLGAYRIPPETGILIPSGFANLGTRSKPKQISDRPPECKHLLLLGFTAPHDTPTLFGFGLRDTHRHAMDVAQCADGQSQT